MLDVKPKNLIIIVVTIAVGFAVANLPAPTGLERPAMVYLGIFAGLLILLVTNALPTWASCLGALSVMAICQVAPIADVFDAFSGSIFWLMAAVFAFATAIGNSGLMDRLALKMLTIFPKNYRGQVLSLMAAGFIMSPLIPSSNAKVNLLIPMATAMTEQVGYKPHSKAALGLFTATFLPSYMGSYAFLTGTVNVAFFLGVLKLQFTWIGWLSVTFVWLIVLLIGTYVFCMTYCKPKEKLDLPGDYFEGKYRELGSMKPQEKLTAIVVIAALVLWITQPLHGIDAGMVCMVATIVLVAFNVLTGSDFNTRMPWGLLIFIGALISVGNLMQPLGINDWLAGLLAPVLTPIASNVWVFVPALLLITWALRAVIPAQGVVLIVLAAVFASVLPAAGISLFVLGFVEHPAGNIWFNKFQNPFIMGTLGVAGNKYVTIKEFKKSAYAFMVITLVGCMASIPLWSAMGLC